MVKVELSSEALPPPAPLACASTGTGRDASLRSRKLFQSQLNPLWQVEGSGSRALMLRTREDKNHSFRSEDVY